MGSEAKVVMYS